MTLISIEIVVPSISIERFLIIFRGLIEGPVADTIRLEEQVSILSPSSLTIWYEIILIEALLLIIA